VTESVDASVPPHVIEEANRKLKDAVKRYFEDVDQQLRWYSKQHCFIATLFKMSETCMPTEATALSQ
jgi:hypothetical protein